MDKQLATSFLVEALGRLYSQDISLFEKGPRSELSISYRLAHYLATIIENDKRFEHEIKVDCEYRRHIENPKCCFEGCNACAKGYEVKCFVREHEQEIIRTQKKDKLEKTIRPDIIVHKRGTNHNILVIEIKTGKVIPQNRNRKPRLKLIAVACINRFYYGFVVG